MRRRVYGTRGCTCGHPASKHRKDYGCTDGKTKPRIGESIRCPCIGEPLTVPEPVKLP